MTHSIRTLAALSMAAATLSASLLAAPSAHAEDQRPCVSRAEYNGLFGGEDAAGDMTRRTVEAKWDVAGDGRRVASDETMGYFIDEPVWFLVAYPRCGYASGESWYAAAYHLQKDTGQVTVWAVVTWRDPAGITLHGRP